MSSGLMYIDCEPSSELTVDSFWIFRIGKLWPAPISPSCMSHSTEPPESHTWNILLRLES